MTLGSAWRLRTILTGTLLFLATVAFTLWQNTRIAVLWDLSYLLDSSYRIALGQVPYRDFPFAHAPLTFLIHAVIIHLFGRVYYPHIACAALEAGAATVLTWRILFSLLSTGEDRHSGAAGISVFALAAWPISLLLAVPLTVLGIYAIYPHPIYDSDCILAVLFGLYLLQRAAESPIRNALAGAVCVLPLFFKQNIGLPFLAITLLAVLIITVIRCTQQTPIKPQLCFLSAAFAGLAAALTAIHLTAGLHNYLFWTITFAAQRRLPGLRLILDTYRQTSLLWTIPTAIAGLILLRTKRVSTSSRTRTAAFFLLAAPFLWTIASLALTTDPGDRADQLLSLWPHILLLSAALALCNLRPSTLRTQPSINTMLPLILLATIHGTFLSQQLWGSTYALWPLLLLLLASLLAQIPTVARPLAYTIAATLLLCGGIYSTSHERLGYVHLESDAAIAHATLPELRGLATPGSYIPAFEELIRITNSKIPAADGILMLPGEDPFYFATGRTPQFPILLFDPATDPYTPQQTLEQARTHNIRWLIVTRNLQLTQQPQPDLPVVLQTLQQNFVFDRTLTNYDIYRRR
jgi:hypothetical protein